MSGVLHLFDAERDALAVENIRDPYQYYAVDLGTLVLVQGRVRLFHNAPELLVQQLVPCADPNALPAQWLSAIKLARTVYSHPPRVEVASQGPSEGRPSVLPPALGEFCRKLFVRLDEAATDPGGRHKQEFSAPSGEGQQPPPAQPPSRAPNLLERMRRIAQLQAAPAALPASRALTAAADVGIPLHPWAVPFSTLLADDSLCAAARDVCAERAAERARQNNAGPVAPTAEPAPAEIGRVFQEALAGLVSEGIVARDVMGEAFIALDTVRVLVPATVNALRRLLGHDVAAPPDGCGATSWPRVVHAFTSATLLSRYAPEHIRTVAGKLAGHEWFSAGGRGAARAGPALPSVFVSAIADAVRREPLLERVPETRVREALELLSEQSIVYRCAPDLYALTE